MDTISLGQFSEKLGAFINTVHEPFIGKAHHLLSDVTADICTLNYVLLPFVEAQRSVTKSDIPEIREAAKNLLESHHKLSNLLQVRTVLDRELHDFLLSDDNLIDIDSITRVVYFKDEELDIIKKCQLSLFHEYLLKFIIEDEKKPEPDKELSKVEEHIKDAHDLLNELKDQLSDLLEKIKQNTLDKAAAKDQLEKIRHAARGLDNSFNEIGATILGTTAVPLHGALHEFLGSIDATITARDGDRIERHLQWVNEHIDLIQDYQQRLKQAPIPDKKPRPEPHP